MSIASKFQDLPFSTSAGEDLHPAEIPDPRKVSSPEGIRREGSRSSGRTSTQPVLAESKDTYFLCDHFFNIWPIIKKLKFAQ